jgi:hypothetical protein
MRNLEHNKELAVAIGLAGNVSSLAKQTSIPRSTLYEQVNRGFLGWYEAEQVARRFNIDQLRLMKPPSDQRAPGA